MKAARGNRGDRVLIRMTEPLRSPLDTPNARRLRRREFLKRTAAAVATGIAVGVQGAVKAGEIRLSREHLRAVNRRRRITVQYDGYNNLGKDWDEWLKLRFGWLDAPEVQIDSVWWDVQPLLKGYYPTPPNSLIYEWPDAKTDIVARLVEETRKRGLEVFWNHRISEVDLKPPNVGGGWTKEPHPLKKSHPDWVMDTWWPHGLWDLTVAGVREHKARLLKHVAETYPIDGIQLDFARHVPCLPPGRQWELRGHVTRFVRMVREMTLDVARRRGRPILLAVRIPRSPAGCRADGFDVASWADQNLVDIFSLGSRSIEVDIEGFRRIVGGRPIKLQPCLDDHHAPDGYRSPPIETFRGTFANWWQQGADSVMTFNWMAGKDPPASEVAAYREVGSAATLAGKDKTFVVERRGGYPWADGYFNHNADAPLPKALVAGETAKLSVRFAGPTSAVDGKTPEVTLDIVFHGATKDDQFDVRMNEKRLRSFTRDAAWKDPQIFSPKPTPASGGRRERYRIDPRQRLTRLSCKVAIDRVKTGVNEVAIDWAPVLGREASAMVQVEKVEMSVRYSA
jgi:hypothetical protein